MRPGMQRHNGRVMAMLIAVAVGMGGLAYASVPLYKIFCEATGFAGTTHRAQAAPGAVTDRWVTVRFNADIAPELAWSFQPVEKSVRVHPGEETLVSYRATNKTKDRITGTATYNVTPQIVGAYFNKIACFCFTEQTLDPGESVEMPVSFFVDPAMFDDKNTRSIDEITLSYTFFRAKNQPKQTADLRPDQPSGSDGGASASVSNRR